MATKTTQAPATAQLLVSISDLSMLNDIKKAISMLKGVTTVKKAASKREQSQARLSTAEREQARPGVKQKQKEFDITKTKGFQEALDDVKHGRVYHAESVDDMFKQILGEEAFSKIRRSHV